MSPRVLFNNLEIWALRELAQRRWKVKTDAASDSKRVDQKRDSLWVNFVGVKAEYAVAKHHDLEIDLEVFDGPDPGFDLKTKTGRTVQVKYTAYTQGALSFRSLEHFKADLGVLVTPVARADERWDAPFQLEGYVTRERFVQEHVVEDWGYGPQVVMWSKNLEPFA